MRDLFNLRRPQPATPHEPEPERPERPERAVSEWDPIDPTDGKPRLVLTWVTTEAGSGFAVDTFNIATEQIASFYMDGGAAVASLTRQSEEKANGTATAVEVERTDALEDAFIPQRRQRGFAG